MTQPRTNTRTEALRHPAAGRIVVARGISDLGDFLGLAAIILHTYDTAGSLVGPGSMFAAFAVPSLLLGTVGATRLNRIHPRTGQVAAYLTAAGVISLIAFSPPLWLTLLCVAVLGGLRSVTNALRLASVASSVPEHLQQATMAWTGVTYQVGQFAGFIAGAALVATVGGPVAILGDALTFVLAALVLSRAPLIHALPDAEATARAEAEAAAAAAAGRPRSTFALITGLREAFTHRTLAMLLPLLGPAMLASAMPETAAPELGQGIWAGFVMAAAPAAASVASARMANKPDLTDAQIAARATMYGATLMAVGLAIGVGAPLWVVLLGLLANGWQTTWVVGVQLRLVTLPDASRVAEVNAATNAALVALEGFGALGLGVLASITGLAVPFLVVGGLLVPLAVAARVRFRRSEPSGRADVLPRTAADERVAEPVAA